MNVNFIFILLGMNTLIIFLFKREWLLNKKTLISLFLINLLLFVLGYIFQYSLIGNPKFVVSLKMPLISQLIFVFMNYIFYKIYNRNPVDTFWTMDRKLMKDGIFNFMFWVLAGVLPAIIVFGKMI